MIVYASTRILRQQGERERIWRWGSPCSLGGLDATVLYCISGWLYTVGGCIAVFKAIASQKSVLYQLRVKRFAVIQEGICLRTISKMHE